MLAFLLLLLATQHPGAAPTDWTFVTGEPHVKYRWSRPVSNSCLVEFSSEDHLAARQFDAVARFVSNRPQAPVQPNSISAVAPAPTQVRQQTAERAIHVELPRMGRDAEEIHDCYGIVQLRSQVKATLQNPEQEPPSQPRAK